MYSEIIKASVLPDQWFCFCKPVLRGYNIMNFTDFCAENPSPLSVH